MDVPNTLLQEGRLLVKTEGPLGRRSWILRYILLGERTLEWYADVERNQLVGSVALDGAILLEPENPKHPYMIELDWDGQDYLPLRALSLLEFRSWVTALSQSVVTVSPSVMNTLMAQEDMMYTHHQNSSLNSSTAASVSSPSRKFSAVSSSSSAASGTNSNATVSVTSSPMYTGLSLDPKLFSQPGGMLSPGDSIGNTSTTTSNPLQRSLIPPLQLSSSSIAPFSSTLSTVSVPVDANSKEPLAHPLNHPTMVNIVSNPMTGTVISPTQLKEAQFDPTVSATETIPNVSIANVHRQRASQAAAIARMMVKSGAVTGNMKVPTGTGKGGKRPPPPPPPSLTPEEIEKLVTAATIPSSTVTAKDDSINTNNASKSNDKESVSIITMASPSSILNNNSSNSNSNTNSSSATSSSSSRSLPFATTLTGHGSLYILRPTPLNHLSNITSTVNTPTEVWMPRYGILDGHEIHLYQSNKANRELETVELLNAVAVHTERKASPPPLAECIMITLASGNTVFLAIPMVPEGTLVATDTTNSGKKLLTTRDHWIYAINACAQHAPKTTTPSNTTTVGSSVPSNENSASISSPSQSTIVATSFTASPSSNNTAEDPNIPPHKRSKWNKLRVMGKLLVASSQAQETSEIQASNARQSLLNAINQSTVSPSTSPNNRSNPVPMNDNRSSDTMIDDDIRHSPVPPPPVTVSSASTPSLVSLAAASRLSNLHEGNVIPSNLPSTNNPVSSTVSPRSRSSSNLSSSRTPYSFSVRITKLSYDYITSLPSITNKLENAILDDCVYITNEPRDIFSITKLSAGSIVAKMLIQDRPIEKAVLLGQKIRTAMEHPDNLHTPAINRIIQDQSVNFDSKNTVPPSVRSVNRSPLGPDAMAEYVALDPHFPIGALPTRIHHYLDAELAVGNDGEKNNDTNTMNNNNNDTDDTPIPVIEVPNPDSTTDTKNNAPPVITQDTLAAATNVSVIPEETNDEVEDDSNASSEKKDDDEEGNASGEESTNANDDESFPPKDTVPAPLSFEPSPLLRGGELITEVITEVPEPEQSRSTDNDDDDTVGKTDDKNNATVDDEDDEESVILVDHTNEKNLDSLVGPSVPTVTITNESAASLSKPNDYDTVIPDDDDDDDTAWLNSNAEPPSTTTHTTTTSPRTTGNNYRNLTSAARLLGNAQSSLLASLSPSNTPKTDNEENTTAVPNYLRKLNREFDANSLKLNPNELPANNANSSVTNSPFTLPPSLAPQLIRSRYFPTSAISPLDRINRDAGLISNRSVSNALSNAVAHRTSPTASNLSPASSFIVPQTTQNETTGNPTEKKATEPTMLPLDADGPSTITETPSSEAKLVHENEEEKKNEDNEDATLSSPVNNGTVPTEKKVTPETSAIASEIAAAIAILSSPSLISSPASALYRPLSRATNNNDDNVSGTNDEQPTYPPSTLSPGSGAHVHHSPYKASLPLPPSVWTPRPVVEDFIKNELQAVHALLVNLSPSTIGTLVSIPFSLITSFPPSLTAQFKDGTQKTSSEEYIGQLISSLITLGETTDKLTFPLDVTIKENFDILDECLDIAGVGFTLTEKDAELLQPGAQAVQLQIDPIVVEAISLRISRILHGDSVWRMAPNVMVTTSTGKSSATSTKNTVTDDTAATNDPNLATVTSPEPTNDTDTLLSPSTIEEKRKIDSLISEPLTSDTVKKQKDALLQFYQAIVPNKATDDHVNLAWENYGISVWPALASKYTTPVVAPYASAAGLPLPLLVPGRLESELAEIRARRPSDANSIATAGMSVNMNPFPSMPNYTSSSPVTTNMSPNNLRSFSFSNNSPSIMVPNNSVNNNNNNTMNPSTPTVNTQVPYGPNSPVNFPPPVSPSKTNTMLPHLHQRLQHKASPVNGIHPYSPASTARAFTPNSSLGNNTNPYATMDDDTILKRMNDLKNTVDTSRKQLDDLYSLYDTLQATRLSGRGSTTAGPMLAEILKGIEKMQNTQQTAQAELSTLAATLAERAANKALPTDVPTNQETVKETETTTTNNETVPTDKLPVDTATEEEKKDDERKDTPVEASTGTEGPKTATEAPPPLPSLPSISRTATPLNNRPWLFNARIPHGNYDDIISSNERKQAFEQALLNDCSKIANTSKDIFKVIALAKGSIIVTMGILGGLSDEEANEIGQRLQPLLELTNPEDFAAALPEVASLLLPPRPTDEVANVPKENEPLVPSTVPSVVTEAPTVPKENEASSVPITVDNAPSVADAVPVANVPTPPLEPVGPSTTVTVPSLASSPPTDVSPSNDLPVPTLPLIIPDIDNLPEPTIVPLTVPRTRRAQQHRSILETPSFQKLMAELDDDKQVAAGTTGSKDAEPVSSTATDDLSLDSIRAVAKELGLEPLDYPTVETTMPTVPVDSASISSPVMDAVPAPSLLPPLSTLADDENSTAPAVEAEETVSSPTITETTSVPTDKDVPKEDEPVKGDTIAVPETAEPFAPSSSSTTVPNVPPVNDFTSIDDAIPLSITPTRARTPVDTNATTTLPSGKPTWSLANPSEIEPFIANPNANPLGTSVNLVRSIGSIQNPSIGILRYIGPTQFDKGNWLGIELEKPEGYHDGTVDGVSYFICHGNENIGARPGTSASLPFGIFVTHPLLDNYRKDTTTNETTVPVTDTSKTDTGMENTDTPVTNASITDDKEGSDSTTVTAVPLPPPVTTSLPFSSSEPTTVPVPTVVSPSSAARDGYIVHIPGRRSPMSGNNSILSNSTSGMNGGLNMVPLPGPVTPRMINNKLLESVLKGMSPATPPLTDIHISQANNANSGMPSTTLLTAPGPSSTTTTTTTTNSGRKGTAPQQTPSPRPRPEWNSSTKSKWSRTDWREKLSQLDEKPILNDEEIIFLAANPNNNNNNSNGNTKPKSQGSRGTLSRDTKTGSLENTTKSSSDDLTIRDDRSVMSMVLEDAKTAVLPIVTSTNPTTIASPSSLPAPPPTGMVRSPTGMLVPVDPSRAIHTQVGDIFVLKATGPLSNGTSTMIPTASKRNSPLPPKVSSSPSPLPSSLDDGTLLPIITDEPVMLPGGFTGQRSVLASPQLRKDPSFGGLAITSTPVPSIDGTTGMIDDGFKADTVQMSPLSIPSNTANNTFDAALTDLRPDSDIDAEVDPKLVAWLEAQGLGHIINPLAETIAVAKYALSAPEHSVPLPTNDTDNPVTNSNATLTIPILLSDVASLVPEEVAALPGITPIECTKLNEAINVLKVLVPPKLVLPVMMGSNTGSTNENSSTKGVPQKPESSSLPLGGKPVNSKLGQLPPLSDASFSLSSNDNGTTSQTNNYKGSSHTGPGTSKSLVPKGSTLGAEAADAALKRANQTLQSARRTSNHSVNTRIKPSSNSTSTSSSSNTVPEASIDGPEITLRNVRIVANTVNADGTPEIILSQAHLDALLGTPSNNGTNTSSGELTKHSKLPTVPPTSTIPSTTGTATPYPTNDIKLKRPRVPSHIVPPRPRTNTNEPSVPVEPVNSRKKSSTNPSTTGTNTVRFTDALPSNLTTPSQITNMNAQTILQSHGIPVTMVKSDKDTNNTTHSSSHQPNFRPDLKAAAAHIRGERKSAHERTMDKLAGRLLHNPASTNTNTNPNNTTASSNIASNNNVQSVTPSSSMAPSATNTTTISTPTNTNNSSSLGLNRFKALQAVAAGLPPNALVTPTVAPTIPSLPIIPSSTVATVPSPMITTTTPTVVPSSSSPSVPSSIPPHHDDTEHHKRTKKQKKHHKKEKHHDDDDHDHGHDNSHPAQEEGENSPHRPTSLSSTLYPVSPSPPVEAITNSPDGKNNVYGNSLLAAANMRGLTSPGSPLVPVPVSTASLTTNTVLPAANDTKPSSLLSPTGAVRAATAPDINDDLADFLMRHGYYHYSFTFSLFDINTLSAATSVCTFDKLKKEMALPDKDAHQLANLFAKQGKGSNGSSTSTNTGKGNRK